jgi:hypothetical protein
MAKRNWKYSGCSARSVPSLSKVATRSAGGTKSGEPCVVTRSTNATIAALGSVSFHDRRGPWATLGAVHDVATRAMAAAQAARIRIAVAVRQPVIRAASIAVCAMRGCSRALQAGVSVG